MLLGGLWHGSSFNFIIWGAIHGGMLAFERAMGKDSFWSKLQANLDCDYLCGGLFRGSSSVRTACLVR